jgi:hypothetical protein
MKSGLRPTLHITGLALLIAFGVGVIAQAQNREKYIISATAGGINFTSGNVTVQRRGSSRQHALTAKDDLDTGDSVTTGAGGRVEVLLNPGSYMRVDENSEFVFTDASLDNLRVRLLKGSALLEITGVDDIKFEIGFSTPQTDALIIRKGIYRFNALANETTEISVRKGRALFGKGFFNEVKGGQKVLIGRNLLEVAKLDKKNQDTLDVWSKERAETLAHANGRLQSGSLAAAFDDYNSIQALGIIPSSYGFGLWVYSQRLGGYCFLPFGWRGWSSPYGYGYGTAFGYAGSGWGGGGGNQGNYGNPSTGNGATGSTGGNPGGYTGGNTNPTPAPQPTHQPTWTPSSSPIERTTPVERAAPVREAPTANPND